MRALVARVPWWAWTLAGVVGGLVLLLVAGGQLADATFGTSLRARGCDSSSVGGLVLLVLAGLALQLGWRSARLRVPGATIVFDPAALAVTVPVPALLLAATLPGVLGCGAATDVARVGIVGDALVGTSGLMLAAAACVLVGAALASCASVVLVDLGLLDDESPGIVELAIAEAEALEEDPGATRFHGVDSGE